MAAVGRVTLHHCGETAAPWAICHRFRVRHLHRRPIVRVIEINTIISNELGLHARSAAQISALAARADAAIWIFKGDQKADARDIMDVLTLECPKGTPVKLIAEEPNDRRILEAIAVLIRNRFGE